MPSRRVFIAAEAVLVALALFAAYFYFKGERVGIVKEQEAGAAASVVIAKEKFKNASVEIDSDVGAGDAAALRARILRLADALNARP